MNEVFNFGVIIAVFFSAIRLATPLIFAALGGMFSERSGIINIALEGLMLAGAFTAAVVTFEMSQPYMMIKLVNLGMPSFLAERILSSVAVPFYGLIAGAIAGGLTALVYAIAVIKFEANQVVAGTAINFLMLGLPQLISGAIYDSSGSTPQIAKDNLLPELGTFIANSNYYVVRGFLILLTIITAKVIFDWLKQRPKAIGGKFNQLISLILAVLVVSLFTLLLIFFFSSVSIASILAFLLVPLCWYVLYKTPFGLRLRAVGENPAAADAAGVNVIRLRYVAVILSGVLAAVGGAYLSIGQSSLFTRGMTAGRGFIALAALILAKWKPVPVLFACLFFGFTEAITIPLASYKLASGENIPVQFVQIIPYVLTIIVLAGFIGLSRAPKALGSPYSKEK